jgi:DNA replication protein DnaC
MREPSRAKNLRIECKDWTKIFNNDSTLIAAILDRLLHHADTVVIEGKSYRMKGKLEP